jgi:type IX secretion system PorP/SprF family membrane protein
LLPFGDIFIIGNSMKGYRLLRALIVIFFVCGSHIASLAQDAHLSQFDAAPLYFNPALSGTGVCDHRFIFNGKQQWGTYRSLLLSYDRRFAAEDLEFNAGGDIGAGILVMNDEQGSEPKLGQTNIKLIPAYHKHILGSALKLSVGANLDFGQKRIDQTGGTLPNGEPLSGAGLESSNRFFFDIDLGANLGATIKNKYPVNFGVAYFHLLRTNKSFVEDGKSTGDKPRLSFNANTIIPLASSFEIWPSAVYMNQKTYSDGAGGFNQLVAGSWLRYNLADQIQMLDAVFLGLFTRIIERSNAYTSTAPVSNDSFIIGLGAEAPVGLGVLNIGISYDITTSDYNKMKQRGEAGSFELSAKYFFCKKEFHYTPPAKLNPVFN